MTFHKMIAGLAVLGLTTQAHAQAIEATPDASAPAAVSAEATPLTQAERLKKARETEEAHTEQRIQERLEASRLSEEQKRAERLFGDRTSVETPAAVPVAPQPPAVTPQPSVRIEKVEIIQPVSVQAEAPVQPAPAPAPAPAVAPIAPVAQSTAAKELIAEEAASAPVEQITTYYVGANLAAPSYDSSRVKSNYGLGATVGMMVGQEYAIEGSFIYSNYYVNNVWTLPIFREMDQYEFQAAFKYYLFNEVLHGRVKPFVGVSASYIYREYTNRQLQQYSYNSSSTTQNTDSFNLGALAGVDFQINERISIGGQFEYSHPIMSRNEFDLSSYGINNGQTKVEQWDFTTMKLTAKYSF